MSFVGKDRFQKEKLRSSKDPHYVASLHLGLLGSTGLQSPLFGTQCHSNQCPLAWKSPEVK